MVHLEEGAASAVAVVASVDVVVEALVDEGAEALVDVAAEVEALDAVDREGRREVEAALGVAMVDVDVVHDTYVRVCLFASDLTFPPRPWFLVNLVRQQVTAGASS